MKRIKTPKLLKNRQGVNAVISNVILVGAVIAVGFGMLIWSQTQASSYNSQYSSAVESDTAQLLERVAFEYIHYDTSTNNLTVYLMNSGTNDGINITTAYINNIPYSVTTLHLLDDHTQTSSLDTTQEAYFWISPDPSLELGKSYSITIVTGRGSSFVGTFATQ